jgi:hypothetical protein
VRRESEWKRLKAAIERELPGVGTLVLDPEPAPAPVPPVPPAAGASVSILPGGASELRTQGGQGGGG